ncbi:hypothetical protein [Curtobacterium sp. PhB146]|uniref:hypothetical protein n=1 Tax=Curtobacterium sp. PhB146 TaxID=2485187 RepID=UPI00104F87FB|nr:hypothetical protein [Curtobacterium sp. PhB146]TCU42792.1 hypothetical protein EDF33_11140 [Curtobacterium sp. PhB146]
MPALMPPVTILDALDNAVGQRVRDGALHRLSTSELDEIRDTLTEFWNAQPDLDGTPSDDQPRASFLGGFLGSFWSEQLLRQELSDALLYYPRLLVLDPLADFFSDGRRLPPLWATRYRRPDGQADTVATGPEMWLDPFRYDRIRADAAAAAKRFAAIVNNLYVLDKPIRAGIIVLRSQWPTIRATTQQLATAVRIDSRNETLQRFLDSADDSELHTWDSIRGMKLEMNLPVVRADRPTQFAPPLYYLAKTIAVAHAGAAQYVPANGASLGLLRARYNDSVKAFPASMLREVSRVAVPTADTPLTEAVAIRASSDDFEAWRLKLQELHRASENDDLDTLQDRVRETLVPAIQDVKRSLSQSRFGASFRNAGSDFIVDGAVGVGTAAAVSAQAELATAVAVGAAGAAGGAMLRWLLRQYGPARPTGANAVLATLIRAPR